MGKGGVVGVSLKETKDLKQSRLDGLTVLLLPNWVHIETASIMVQSNNLWCLSQWHH